MYITSSHTACMKNGRIKLVMHEVETALYTNFVIRNFNYQWFKIQDEHLIKYGQGPWNLVMYNGSHVTVESKKSRWGRQKSPGKNMTVVLKFLLRRKKVL